MAKVLINGMKRHFVGLLLGVIAFSLGVLLSPRVFYPAAGSLLVESNESCTYGTYNSVYGDQVVFWSCPAPNKYKTAEEAFEFSISRYEVISRSDRRAVVSYFTGTVTGYCILRLDGEMENDFCSASVEPLIAFEQRYFAY
jgi:hypothetical protein